MAFFQRLLGLWCHDDPPHVPAGHESELTRVGGGPGIVAAKIEIPSITRHAALENHASLFTGVPYYYNVVYAHLPPAPYGGDPLPWHE